MMGSPYPSNLLLNSKQAHPGIPLEQNSVYKVLALQTWRQNSIPSTHMVVAHAYNAGIEEADKANIGLTGQSSESNCWILGRKEGFCLKIQGGCFLKTETWSWTLYPHAHTQLIAHTYTPTPLHTPHMRDNIHICFFKSRTGKEKVFSFLTQK